MSNSTSSYPQLSVDATGAGVVSHAGSVTLLRTAQVCGLTAALSDALSPWRKPLAHFDPGKIVSDLAVSLAVGGDCLADIATDLPRGFRTLEMTNLRPRIRAGCNCSGRRSAPGTPVRNVEAGDCSSLRCI